MSLKKPKINNIVYFAHPIDSYDNEYEKECIKLIKKVVIPNKIVNPKKLVKKLEKVKNNFVDGILEYQYNEKVFFPEISKCDIFVYATTMKNKVTSGVDKELGYALNKRKIIYKISYENDNIEINKMTKDYIKKIISVNRYANKNWVLKTIDDYRIYQENNPEIKDFMLSQIKSIDINGEKIQHGIVSHLNSVFETNNFQKKDNIFHCMRHQIKHSFIDPSYQQKTITCPFNNISKPKPVYSKFKMDNIEQVSFDNLLCSSRTLHKTMFLYDESVFTKGKGMVLRNERNEIVISGGKPKVDIRKILGTEILYDLDIASYTKTQGLSFFDKPVFNEYIKAIELTQKFVEQRWGVEDYKLGFSGNGIYVVLPSILFGDFNMNFEMFDDQFKDSRITLLDLFKKNDVTKVVLEEKYAWNRYFKILGTFHLNRERLSIPLNKDELLDYDWMKEITDIKTGLEGNVFKEILKRANWS